MEVLGPPIALTEQQRTDEWSTWLAKHKVVDFIQVAVIYEQERTQTERIEQGIEHLTPHQTTVSIRVSDVKRSRIRATLCVASQNRSCCERTEVAAKLLGSVQHAAAIRHLRNELENHSHQGLQMGSPHVRSLLGCHHDLSNMAQMSENVGAEGAESTISILWRIEDAGVAELLESKAEALRLRVNSEQPCTITRWRLRTALDEGVIHSVSEVCILSQLSFLGDRGEEL